MSQSRYYNYGGTLDAETEKFVHYSLNRKGVCFGFEMTVDTYGNLEIDSGTGLQHNGLLWHESDPFTLTFSAPAASTDYTVVATHEDRTIIGGVPIEYTLANGIQTNATTLNGIVLGWIRHPGGGVPLDVDFITEAPKLTEQDYPQIVTDTVPIELIPPFSNYVNSTVGADITITPNEFDAVNFVVQQKVENALGAFPVVQTAIQNFMFFVKSGYQPISIQVYTNFPGSVNTNLTIAVYDTTLAPVSVTNGLIQGMGVWTHNTATVARNANTFTDGEPYTVRLTYTVNQGEHINIGRLVVHTSPFV